MQKEKLLKDINFAFTEVEKLLATTNEETLNYGQAGKWSKKEELGHLVDSAINNIKRFTEIQFKEKPYAVTGYEQNALVAANNYQQQKIEDIFYVWRELNKQVMHLINVQTKETLNYEVLISSTNELRTLSWLMEDYVEHLLHHVKQINGK